MGNQFGKTIPTQNRFPVVDPKHFQDPSEEVLFKAIRSVKTALHTTLIDRRETKGHQWQKAFALLAELQNPVNALFEKVKIIDDDAAVRTNRLALLQEVWDLSEELLDFSKIQEQ